MQVWKDDVLFAGLGSSSSPVTVASFVRHSTLAGAVPVRVIVNVPPLASAPSAHMTALPLTEQPLVVVLTFVNPLGTLSVDGEARAVAGPVVRHGQRPGDGATGDDHGRTRLYDPQVDLFFGDARRAVIALVGDRPGVVSQQREGRVWPAVLTSILKMPPVALLEKPRSPLLKVHAAP